MNIITPTILPNGVANVTRLAEIAPLIPAALTLPAAMAATVSTIVEISRLGQFLSSVSEFQKALIRLQSTPPTGTQDPDVDFDNLKAATQRLVEVFNSLHNNGIADLQLPIDTLTGDSLVDQFVQTLNQQANAVYDNGTSAFTRLSQIGLLFQASSVAGNARGLSINLPLLRSAFNSDRAGTISLLSQAAGAFGTLAEKFTQFLATISGGEGFGTLLEGTTSQALDLADIFGADTSLISSGFSVDDAAFQNLLASEALDSALLENTTLATSQSGSTEPSAASIVTSSANANETEGIPEGNAGETSVAQGFVENQERADETGDVEIALAATSPAIGADILQTGSISPAARAPGQQQSTNDAGVVTNPPITSTPQDSAGNAATNGIVAAQRYTPIRDAVPTATDATDELDLTIAATTSSGALLDATLLDAGTAVTEIRNTQPETVNPLESRSSASATRPGARTSQTSATTPSPGNISAGATNASIGNALFPATATTITANDAPRVAGIESANSTRDFAQDPAVVAAIAAYRLSEGLLGLLTSGVQERAPARTEVIPQVGPVARVTPIQKLAS